MILIDNCSRFFGFCNRGLSGVARASSPCRHGQDGRATRASICQTRDGRTYQCGVIDADYVEVNALLVFEVLFEVKLNAGF